MTPHQPIPEPLLVLAAAVAVILTWYCFQVFRRKKEWLAFKFKRVLVGETAFLGSAYLLAQNKLPVGEVMLFSLLIGFGVAFILVREPRSRRRIPKSLRQQVIARDLIAKGLKWDPEKHHIDHIVPYSRGGDTSLKNLRVVEKKRNLQKGGKMPRMRDFFEK